VENLSAELLYFARENGAGLIGVADMAKIAQQRILVSKGVRELMNYAVVMAIRLSEAILSEIMNSPTKTYYHHYRTVNFALDQLALKITRFLQSKGYFAYPVPASQVVDWENQQAIFSHRHAAVQAGLGWIGRNNLLVTPRYGAQLRLVSVLTNAPLEASQPLDEDCRTCRACLDVCPAQAIADDPEMFDHHRCYAQINWFIKQRIVGQHICGICVKACGAEQVQNR